MSDHDFSAALERLGGSHDLLVATASIVAEDVPDELDKLKAAIHSKDTEAARSAAHTLRGMLSTFDDGIAITELLSLQQALEQKNAASVFAHFEAVRPHVLLLVQKLHHLCSK